MGFQVICLGAINVDLTYEVADLGPFLESWPPLQQGGEAALGPDSEEALLQDLLSRHARPGARHGGGQAANTAWALARMGLEVALLGRVGADEDGAFLRDSLVGVNLDHLVTQGSSGRAYVLVDPTGERTILVAPNTNDDLRGEDLPWAELTAASFLHLTSFVGEKPLLVQGEIARRLQGGPSISLDPGELYARRGRPALADLLAHVETLLVTEKEWGLLGGEMECHPQWAPPIVLIKRGAMGAKLLTRHGSWDFSGETGIRLVDTLGAGDVFAAGYLAGRVSGLDLAAAVRLGGRAAACKLTGAGRERYPDQEFLAAQIDLLR